MLHSHSGVLMRLVVTVPLAVGTALRISAQLYTLGSARAHSRNLGAGCLRVPGGDHSRPGRAAAIQPMTAFNPSRAVPRCCSAAVLQCCADAAVCVLGCCVVLGAGVPHGGRGLSRHCAKVSRPAAAPRLHRAQPACPVAAAGCEFHPPAVGPGCVKTSRCAWNGRSRVSTGLKSAATR